MEKSKTKKMKEQIENLIANLKSDPDFDTVTVREGTLEDWEYYSSIYGYCKGKYFRIEISKLKQYPESHSIEVVDCKPEINEKLRQFKIITDEEKREIYLKYRNHDNTTT